MKIKWLKFGFMAAVIGLLGCDRQDATVLQSDQDGVTGFARIALPALPSGYLQDSGQKALFVLTVAGPTKDTVRYRWELRPDRSQPILVDGLSAGVNHFQGRLLRFDSLAGDSVVTHEGENTALIKRDSVTDVRLSLKAGGSGTAHICVDVEGWPPDSTCAVIPSEPVPVQKVLGCWSIQARHAGDMLGEDSLLQGHLIIVKRDSMMSAELTWISGRVDTTTALYHDGERLIYFGEGGHGDFLFKAHLDSTDILYGPFVDTALGIEGDARATRTACLPETSENKRCFDFKQIEEGAIITGRMGIETDGNAATFFVHWQGIGSRVGQGTVHGNLDSSASVSGVVITPPGLPSNNIDPDSVLFQFQVVDSQLMGAVFPADNPTLEFGKWSGHQTLCISHDFKW